MSASRSLMRMRVIICLITSSPSVVITGWGHEGQQRPRAGPGRNFAQNMQSVLVGSEPRLANPDMTGLTLPREILLWWSHACLMKKHICWHIRIELCSLFRSLRQPAMGSDIVAVFACNYHKSKTMKPIQTSTGLVYIVTTARFSKTFDSFPVLSCWF